ncbi:MAG: hypothetical protein LAP40_06910 [Acidobacteriia bacterium]|nr:hypothetical protein [Terriglobia bacterium]
MIDANTNHARRGYWATVFEQKHQPAAFSNDAQLQDAVPVNRAVQVRGYRIRAVLRMTRNPNRASPETLNPVAAALGFDVNHGTTRQVLTRH